MKVRFTKDHPGGMLKGEELDVRQPVADKWMDGGYIELVDELVFEVEKPKASLKTGGEASNKKSKKRGKFGKGKK